MPSSNSARVMIPFEPGRASGWIIRAIRSFISSALLFVTRAIDARSSSVGPFMGSPFAECRLGSDRSPPSRLEGSCTDQKQISAWRLKSPYRWRAGCCSPRSTRQGSPAAPRLRRSRPSRSIATFQAHHRRPDISPSWFVGSSAPRVSKGLILKQNYATGKPNYIKGNCVLLRIFLIFAAQENMRLVQPLL